jgi:hypothetical protein
MVNNISTAMKTGQGSNNGLTTQSSQKIAILEKYFLSAVASRSHENSSHGDLNEDSDLTPAREREIDQWVEDNANADDGFLFINFDDAGGQRVSKALDADSPLGVLTSAEKRQLIDAAALEWCRTGNTENIRETAKNLKGPTET